KFDETFSEAWDHFKDLLPAGGNLLNRTPRDALMIFENKSKVRTSRNKPVVSKLNTTTSSSSPSPNITIVIDIVKELVLMNKANQQAFVKAIEESCVICGGPHPYYEYLATGGNTFDAWTTVETYNQGGSGTLSGNTIANPKGELKAITTRSGLVTEGPTVPNPPKPINPEEDECVEETYTDPDHPEYNIKVPPPPPVQKPKPPI
nr:hypothetical protein [Tanacetum cinerariifolium]